MPAFDSAEWKYMSLSLLGDQTMEIKEKNGLCEASPVANYIFSVFTEHSTLAAARNNVVKEETKTLLQTQNDN